LAAAPFEYAPPGHGNVAYCWPNREIALVRQSPLLV